VHPRAGRPPKHQVRARERSEVTTTILICATGWVLGWWLFGRARRLADLPPPIAEGIGRPVTVVVPARDEELSLGGLLGDLQAARPPDTHVVVVDDHSTDATARIAADHDLVTLLPAPDLPAGWTGKTWACHSAADLVPDGVLVFLDADVRLGPGALEQVVEEQARTGGLVSVQPWHHTERAYEQLSALFNVISVMGSGAGDRTEVTTAFGPVLVTSVRDYHTVGGHASVCDQVVEDLALARRYHDAGLGCRVLLGLDGIRFRMYPGGLRQLVEGWTKNFASGAGSTGRLRLAAVVAWIGALGTAAFAVADGVRGEAPLAIGVLAYLAFALQLVVMFRQVGRFGVLTALCYPVLLVFFLAVFLRSMWLTYVRRAIRWRGRVIDVGAGRD
jgi:4,4'-diaponeurosporenoate glycosyltransferase